jgi:hypothetical protein
MSALFERHDITKLTPIALNRTLELRQVPHLQRVEYSYPPFINYYSATGDPVNASVYEIFDDLATNWIYSAVFDLTLSSAVPAWSSEGWGFVPVPIPDLKHYLQEQNLGSYSSARKSLAKPTANITVTTSAIRGRTECTHVEGLNNSSSWLDPKSFDPQSGKNLKMELDLLPGNASLTSYFAPSAYYFQCCTNQSSIPQIVPINITSINPQTNKSLNIVETPITPLAIGYWGKTWDGSLSSDFGPRLISAGNFTPKWIAGNGGFKARRIDMGPTSDVLFFSDKVKLQALNCMPIIETSEAEVTVDIKTGKVHHYNILDTPSVVEEAWSDPFLARNRSNPSDPIEFGLNGNHSAFQNLTSRFVSLENSPRKYYANRTKIATGTSSSKPCFLPQTFEASASQESPPVAAGAKF